MGERPAPQQDQAAEADRLRRRVAELEAERSALQSVHQEMKRGLRFSEMVLNSMQDAIYVVTAEDFRITDCNHVFLASCGLSRKEVIGRTCYQVKMGRSSPCMYEDGHCPSLDTFKTGRPSRSERSMEGPLGGKVYYECTTLPVLDPDGGVRKIVHIDRDITGHKRTESQLKKSIKEQGRSNAFLRNLINSSVDAIISSDMTGRILIFNQAAGQISGYSEQAALDGLDIRNLYPEGEAKEIMRRLRSKEHGGKGKLKNHETEILRIDAMPVPIMLSAAIVYHGDQEVATVGFFYDMREKKRMEAELDKTRVQLLQAEKMASIGKLAAGVAHQLNNPLAGITLFAHILKEEYDLPEQAQDDLQRILDNAERSRDTIKELLQFARQTDREVRLTDLNQALERTLFLLQNQSHFQNIIMKKDLDRALPEIPVDIQQLNHVFMNLVLNAADAMDGQGELTVRTSLSPDEQSLLVEIADTGPGIPDTAIDHIFEPFFTTKEEGKGTGLGLSVAYGIIENHRGRIQARNLGTGGASFLIELPIRRDDDKGVE